ncbi:MAG: tetratricopeptide repeat protein [Acidobacteriota bacterium]|nr:MAG: tetratricopeptide repeat protein [Acidobacteriota bacterium]
MKKFATFVITVFVLGAFSADAQSRKDRDQAKKLREQADKAFQQKRYRAASDDYSKALSLVANDAHSNFWRGSAHYYLFQECDKAVKEIEAQQKSENDAARRAAITSDAAAKRTVCGNELTLAANSFTTALTLGHKPLDVFRIRYFVYQQQERYDLALMDIDAALKLAPNDAAFWKARGDVLFARKDHAKALEAYVKATAIDPNDGNAFYSAALCAYQTGDVKAQQQYAEMSIQKGSLSPGSAFFLLGDAHHKERRYTQAIEAYRRSIGAKQDMYEAYRRLAEVLRVENRLNEAIDVARSALRVFPNDGGIYTDLSWYYSLADRSADAVDAGKAAVLLLPNEHMGYTNLCRAYNDTKQYDLAISACNTALRLKPGDGETHFYLGRALNLTGKTIEATRQYMQAVKGLEVFVVESPDYADGWYLLGNAYFADNQRDKAQAAYLRCLEISPKFTKARYNLGIIYTRKKDRAGAMGQYQALLQLDEKLANALKAEIDRM